MPLSDPAVVDDAYSPWALGFSDLEDDEAFLIWMYRHWQTAAATLDEAEADLSGRLSRDRLHGCLAAVFDLFRSLGRDPGMTPMRVGAPLLTPLEMGMLDLLTARQEGDDVFACCARSLAGSGVVIRPPATLAASHIDRIESRIAGSYSTLMGL